MFQLFNKDFTPAQYNPDVPFWFCDVDGALNALPYEMKWIGTEEALLDDYEVIYNGANWEKRIVYPIADYDYRVTDEVEITNNKNGDYPSLPPKWVTYVIRFNRELMNEISDIIRSGKVNFVWHTTWKQQAITQLSPVFGFPETPFLQWNNFTDHGVRFGKRDAILKFYKDSGSRQPFIWVDDDATESYANSSHCKPGVDYSLIREKTQVDSLILRTDPRWGMNRKELDEIKQFLNM